MGINILSSEEQKARDQSRRRLDYNSKMKSGIKWDSGILEVLNEFLNGFTKKYTNNVQALICHFTHHHT